MLLFYSDCCSFCPPSLFLLPSHSSLPGEIHAFSTAECFITIFCLLKLYNHGLRLTLTFHWMGIYAQGAYM